MINTGGASTTDPFTPEEIIQLSAEIDRQLLVLGTPGTGAARGGTLEERLPALQRQPIEQAAHKDLCKEDGMLYTQ
jgi:hypothetical protein